MQQGQDNLLTEVKELRAEVKGLKAQVKELQTEAKGVKAQVKELQTGAKRLTAFTVEGRLSFFLGRQLGPHWSKSMTWRPFCGTMMVCLLLPSPR